MSAANANFDPARSDDVAAIEAVVKAVESSQAARDPDAFLALFWPEAVWTTGWGHRLTGLAEIGAFTRRVLTPDLGEGFARYSLAHLTFLTEDVAAANIRQQQFFGDGSPVPEDGEGRPLYVMVRRRGVWKIAVGQNTPLQAAAIEAQQAAFAAA